MSTGDFVERLAEPAGWVEDAGAAGGVVAVVDLSGVGKEEPPKLARRAVRAVPGVIVGIRHQGATPAALAWADLVDVVLACSDEGADDHEGAVDHEGGLGAGTAAVSVGADLEGELDRLVKAATARPRAAAALALLLRGEPGGVEDGLVAESAVYSMLQGGPEFAAWRTGRPARPSPENSPAPVLVARDGRSLTVTLSRPARHNALNTAMRDALVEALAVGVADETLRVTLQGVGPSFCSGGDLDEFGTTPDPATSHLVRLTRSPAALAARLGPRLEARVHGACIGAGAELAAFAGRVVAHPDAFFALPEMGMGLVPGSGGTVSLPRRIGRHRTAWMLLSGERLRASRARGWGLVDELVE